MPLNSSSFEFRLDQRCWAVQKLTGRFRAVNEAGTGFVECGSTSYLGREVCVMPPLSTRYVLLSVASGAAWGIAGYVLGVEVFRSAIWGAVFSSPIIGLVVGLVFRWLHRLPTSGRVFASLLSLYFSGTLFGLAVGFSDLVRLRALGVTTIIPSGVVLQAVSGVLWGITFTGYFVVLWPLAYLNHHLLGGRGQVAPTGASAETVRRAS